MRSSPDQVAEADSSDVGVLSSADYRLLLQSVRDELNELRVNQALKSLPDFGERYSVECEDVEALESKQEERVWQENEDYLSKVDIASLEDQIAAFHDPLDSGRISARYAESRRDRCVLVHDVSQIPMNSLGDGTAVFMRGESASAYPRQGWTSEETRHHESRIQSQVVDGLILDIEGTITTDHDDEASQLIPWLRSIASNGIPLAFVTGGSASRAKSVLGSLVQEEGLLLYSRSGGECFISHNGSWGQTESTPDPEPESDAKSTQALQHVYNEIANVRSKHHLLSRVFSVPKAHRTYEPSRIQYISLTSSLRDIAASLDASRECMASLYKLLFQYVHIPEGVDVRMTNTGFHIARTGTNKVSCVGRFKSVSPHLSSDSRVLRIADQGFRGQLFSGIHTRPSLDVELIDDEHGYNVGSYELSRTGERIDLQRYTKFYAGNPTPFRGVNGTRWILENSKYRLPYCV